MAGGLPNTRTISIAAEEPLAVGNAMIDSCQHLSAYNRQSERGTMRALLVALFVGVLSSLTSSLAAERETVRVAQAKAEQIDINRAKAEELMTLKGIGEGRAAAIIKGRPYTRKDELVQKKILPESVYNEIKDKIIAKQ